MKNDFFELHRIGFELSNIGFKLNNICFNQGEPSDLGKGKHVRHLYAELIHANFGDITNVLEEAEQLVRQDFPESDEDKLRAKFLKILSMARMITECQEITFSEMEKIMEGKINDE